MTPLYETSARAVGGREGHVETADGLFKADLAMPKALGGNGNGANPEQLFAAGYAACYMGALRLVSGKAGTPVGPDTKIATRVGIGPNTRGEGFNLDIGITVSDHGLEQSVIDDLIQKAHQVCPYSNATRGNVDVELKAV